MTAHGMSDGNREDGGTKRQADGHEEATPDDEAESGMSGLEPLPSLTLLRRYRVNVLVTRQEPDGAPIVREINPSFANLVGHFEFGLRNGLPVTDHLMLKPGALHRANGGYLILQARDLFTQPRAWQAIKRTLRFGVISIEDGAEVVALPASASLRPEPIPARLKVILIGDPQTYAILTELDPEFAELFKVRADFDNSMPHTPEAEQYYAQFLGDIVRCAALPPLRADAVAMCIEEGGRQVADQARLSAVLSDVRDLALEAASVAPTVNLSPTTSIGSGEQLTTREHVMRVLTTRERRLNLAADHIDEMIREGTILIDTSGDVVGQINGLTVLLSGGYSFGMPARITARTAPGLAGIVNIERETMMSGPAHTKGILVLGGYLAGRFARKLPLSLSATICLEQVYGEIEGDSASSAELYALLSSLSGLPLKQSLAVTGSVNQHGVVQAIGGVNEKIEGFFRVCAQGQLTGEHGVIIPRANVRNLMLRQEVIDAVRAGVFHIYAVSTIDEGIELLTGVPAGTADAGGLFPPETVNGRVSQTLREFTQSMRKFSTFPPFTNQHVADSESAYAFPNGAR
ncbi:MAG TPA: AAA family ATPase [Ktedonobacterales bacterium]|jgi:predicted ATP-dependent protease